MRSFLLDALRKGKATITPPAPGAAALEEVARALGERARQRLGRSLAIREIDAGSCNGCELEIHAINNPVYDVERFGLKFVASPRHADVLLVTGPVTWNMREALLRTYNAAPEPKWVVALGDCATNCGVFAGSPRRGRAAGRNPAGRPARARMSASAARHREGSSGPDRGAGLAGPAAAGSRLACRLRIVRRDMTEPSQPLKLLLSDFALRTWGSRIAAADAGLSFVTAEQALAADGPSAIDIAFMTREVTGRSSKDNQTPELRGFEAVLRKSPKLRWLQIHPAGAERPIYRELRDRGVKVTTASGATAVTVSHSVLGAVIASTGASRCWPMPSAGMPGSRVSASVHRAI
jgi:Ni,Fe-hydrogenase III small subunit